MKRNYVVSAFVVLTASCGGDGATGPAGSSGTPGPQGPTGPPGPLPAGYLSVVDFGAKSGVPSFDNTASFQRALDSAAHAGGGTVWVPVGRFFFAGNLSIPANVALAGAGVGPYDPDLDPATNTRRADAPPDEHHRARVHLDRRRELRAPGPAHPISEPGGARCARRRDHGPIVYPPTVRRALPDQDLPDQPREQLHRHRAVRGPESTSRICRSAPSGTTSSSTTR